MALHVLKSPQRLLAAKAVSLRAFVVNLRDLLYVAIVMAEEGQGQYNTHLLNCLQGNRSSRSGPKTRAPDMARAVLLQRKANDARAAGKTRRALRLYSEAIAITPYNAALFLLRGIAFLDASRPQEAAQDFVSGLQFDPGNETLTFLMHTANALAAQKSVASKKRFQVMTSVWRWQK